MPVICGHAAKVVPEIIDALNGSGPKPKAVTIGGTVVYFGEKTQELEWHEYMHVVQAARYAPWWAKWLPLRAKAWAGAPRYWKAYEKEHREKGYEGNKFELEASLYAARKKLEKQMW